MRDFKCTSPFRKNLFAKSVILIMILLCCNGFAQKKMSADFGLYGSYTFPTNGPTLAFTPYIAFSYEKLQFGCSLDIYDTPHSAQNIYGVSIIGRFFLRPLEKRNNWFVSNYFQYVNFGIGSATAVPYNYVSQPPWEDLNINQYKSFQHLITIGYQVRFLWLCNFQIEAGGGYSYYDRKVTPPGHGQTYSSNPWPAEKKTLPIAFVKLGLSFRLWKNY